MLTLLPIWLLKQHIPSTGCPRTWNTILLVACVYLKLAATWSVWLQTWETLFAAEELVCTAQFWCPFFFHMTRSGNLKEQTAFSCFFWVISWGLPVPNTPLLHPGCSPSDCPPVCQNPPANFKNALAWAKVLPVVSHTQHVTSPIKYFAEKQHVFPHFHFVYLDLSLHSISLEPPFSSHSLTHSLSLNSNVGPLSNVC